MPLLTACVLVLALLFGGGTGQGLWSDALVQVASLPLLAVALARLFRWGASGGSGWPIVLLSVTLILPCLQLIPLPPDWWQQLPGRGPVTAAYAAANIAPPWLPVSLTPAATWRSLLSLLPAAAIFLAVMQLDHDQRRRLILLLLVLVLASIVVDFLQVMQGPTSPLYFYAITNPGSAVGFFANRNHNAALLYCAIPFAAAWGLGLAHASRGLRVSGIFMVGLVVVGAVLSLAIAGSRAGLGLVFLAGLSCIALAAAHRSRHWRRTRVLIAIGGNVLALVLAFQFGFVALAGRLGHSELIEDIRWPVAEITARVAEANDPLGTGFGSFVPVFQTAEPRSLLAPYYINHAHDDWLELWLDGGIPALAVAALFLLWFIGAAFRAWRARGIDADSATLARAASIVILLLLLHSLVDYPLRTTALMVVFGFCAGLLIVAPDGFVAPKRESARAGASAILATSRS
jgi:O-antigen ligase